MKISKSVIDYQRIKRDINSTHNMENSYNKVTIKPNKSLQQSETAGFEFSRFIFANSLLQIQCCYDNVSTVET
jgi:hypothetical protein